MAKKIFCMGLMVMALTIATLACDISGSEMVLDPEPELAQVSLPGVSLWASSGASIEFQTRNGISHEGSAAEIFNIPHLILYHNHLLSRSDQRTLTIEVSGIQAPPFGATVSLMVESQTVDPDAGLDQGQRIPVWFELARLEGDSITFEHTFTEKIKNNGELVNTPTGYFRYEIKIENDSDLLYTFQGDNAFLLENIWVASLPDVPEEAPRAAPDELVIYYCDMIPFRKDIYDPSTWVAREAIHDFVGNDWGFPWFLTWTSPRQGTDPERLSVALTNGKTWYHGQALPRGNSLISLNVAGSENYSYDTLSDGLLSAFHHELFHNLQRSLNQYYGGTGWIGGKQDQWQFIAEGTAVLASAVGQPEIQFAADAGERAYFANANLYLGSETIRSDIGRDFGEISPYHAVLYWRFLFEQCGGMQDPASGMQIIRRVLEYLYRTVEGDGRDDLALGDVLPKIMNQALAGSVCPFQSYDDSLVAFARAIDALAKEGGRCTEPSLPEGCGFYDPNNLYNNPPASTLALMNVSP
jgi:hypothetical protein